MVRKPASVCSAAYRKKWGYNGTPQHSLQLFQKKDNPMAEFCTNCGAPLSGPFCGRCGHRAQSASAPAQPAAPTPQPAAAPTAQPATTAQPTAQPVPQQPTFIQPSSQPPIEQQSVAQ